MDSDKKRHVDRINKTTMSRSVAHYAWSSALTSPEIAGISLIADDARNRPILDLGVGAGRTVRPLMEISPNYVGIDYVPEMVAMCQQRFPDGRFMQADARDLSQFEDNSFFLVVFSKNGICMVNHAGRLAILSEVYRLLQPGGAFLFSSYNWNSANYEAYFKLPEFNPTLHPVKLMVRSSRFTLQTGMRILNRLRYKKQEQRFADYSIINDECHDYSTMLYYTSLENHYNQLEATGFHTIKAFDLAGAEILQHSRDDSVTFLARKF